MSEFLHTTKDGRKIRLDEMSNRHLDNTIAMLKRISEAGLVVGYGGGHDTDEMWYEEDTLYGVDALRMLHYEEYLSERNLRQTLRGAGV
jgi:hypothetical protein